MSLIDDVIAAAMGYVGVPYVWGGSSANGVDCSGLVQQAFRAAGVELPRVSYAQATAGAAVPVNAMQPGDILWYNYSSRNDQYATGADHVAIYLGNGKMIEALHPGEPVHIVSVRTPNGVTRIGGLGASSGDPGTFSLTPNVDSLGNRLAAIARITGGVPSGQPQPDTPPVDPTATPWEQQQIGEQVAALANPQPQPQGEPRQDALVGPR